MCFKERSGCGCVLRKEGGRKEGRGERACVCMFVCAVINNRAAIRPPVFSQTSLMLMTPSSCRLVLRGYKTVKREYIYANVFSLIERDFLFDSPTVVTEGQFSRSELKAAARRSNYDVNSAIEWLLGQDDQFDLELEMWWVYHGRRN